MNLLTFEFSSPQASVALFVDGACVVAESWRGGGRGHHESVLDRLPKLMNEAGLSFEELDLYGVGRGPGHYAGMRVALTVAQGLALPGATPVYAVSSGEALAREVAAIHGASRVVVLGDARRSAYWYGFYEVGSDAPPAWALSPADGLAEVLPEGALLVTSEWERLDGLASQPPLASLNWLREERFPSATEIGRLILERCGNGVPSEPLTPLYMHPAV